MKQQIQIALEDELVTVECIGEVLNEPVWIPLVTKQDSSFTSVFREETNNDQSI